MVRRPPPSWKCQNFPFMYYSHSSLFHWLRIKGNDLVRKRVYLPTPNPGSYYNLIYFTNVLSPLQMLWKENDSEPAHTFSFPPHSRSGLWWFRSSKLTFIKKWHFWNYDSCPQKKTITNKRLNVNVQKKEPIFKPSPSEFPSILIYSFDTAEILISLLIRVFNE